MILNHQKFPFGIDLSDLSVKVAQLEKEKGRLVLGCYSRTEIPEETINKGEISQEKETHLIEILKRAVTETRGEAPKTKKCIVSLPEAESFVDVVSLPKMKKNEIAEAVNWEAEAHIPFKIEDVYLDWQIIKPLRPEAGKMSVLIGAMPKKIVNDYLRILKSAQLQPIAFEIESIATARSLIKNSFAPEPVMIVDFGSKRTSFIIFSGQTIIFTASSTFSNKNFIQKIAQALNIKPQEAFDLKVKKGLRLKDRPELKEVMEDELTELILTIQKYLEYFHSHPTPQHCRQPLIKKIITCGGGANLAGLDEFLEDKLKISVQTGNPWVNILEPPLAEVPELPYEESVAFTTALGLALRGLHEND